MLFLFRQISGVICFLLAIGMSIDKSFSEGETLLLRNLADKITKSGNKERYSNIISGRHELPTFLCYNEKRI